MELCQTNVGFPVFRFTARICYTTARSTTAFERVLLNLTDRFRADERYRAIPLERIFEDILGVSDPLPFIESSLEEMIRLGLLKCESGLDAVDKLTLGSLSLTDQGLRMLGTGSESAVSQHQQEEFEYDPIRRRLLSGGFSGELTARKPTIAIDSAVFEESFPTELIRQSVQNSGYRWWTPQSKIESVECVSSEVAWLESSVAIVTNNDNLFLSCDDPEHTSYLNALPEKQRFESIVRPAIFDGRLLDARLKLLPPADLGETVTGEWLAIPQVLMEYPQRGACWLVNTRLELIDLPESAPKGCALLCFGDHGSEGSPTVVWNSSRDGCFVFVDQEFPVPEAWLICGDQVLVARNVNLSLGQTRFEAPVVHRYVADAASRQIRESLTQIADAILARSTSEDMPALAFWLISGDYWRRLSSHFLNASGSIAERVRQMRRARDNYLLVTGKGDPGRWEESLAAIVAAEAAEHRSLPAEDFSALLSELARCGIAMPSAIGSIIDSLALCLPPLQELGEFSRVCGSIRRTGPCWSIPFPSRLYSEEMIAEVIQRFDSEDVRRCMVNENDFDRNVSELASAYHAVTNALGDDSIRLLEASAHPSGVELETTALEQLIDIVQSWQEHFAALRSACQSLPQHLPGSRLGAADRVIAAIIDRRHALLPGLDPRFRAVYVFDTSALLARPGLLEAIRPEEYVVVAKRVLEELDDKKVDEKLRIQVAKIARALVDFPEDRIEFCQGDMSLLSKDYKQKGDNLILSVAVRYRQAGATLVTNDRILSLKAREEGISVMSADRFAARAQTGSEPVEHTGNSTATRAPRAPRSRK